MADRPGRIFFFFFGRTFDLDHEREPGFEARDGPLARHWSDTGWTLSLIAVWKKVF